MKPRVFLSRLVATFTGPRYFPEIKWAKKCWTHNIFRTWEWLVGRKVGVRCEISFSVDKDRAVIEFHTVEAAIAHFETWVRGMFRTLPKRVYSPRLVTSEGISFAPGVLMAVAFDNSGIQTTNGLTTTITFTLTGSNLMLVSTPFVNSNNDAMSTVVWNTTESLTKDQTCHITSISQYTYFWHLGAPSSGSHSLVGTSVGFNHRNVGASYSGSATTLDTTTQNTFTGTTVTCSITTGVANTMIAAGTVNNSGDANSSNGNVRQHSGVGFSFVDATAASAGSNSVTNTGGGFGAGTNWGYTIGSIKPPVTSNSANTSFFFF